tara:strand:- start:908 stop:1294 length:387 start_codon:yes stop_codon:yes gene_type:complete
MIPKNNSRTTHISAIEYSFLQKYLDDREIKTLDLSASGDISLTSMDLVFAHMGSIEVNCRSVGTPFSINVYFSNSGAKTGTIQGTISIAAGSSNNLIHIAQIPSKYLILEITGSVNGFIDEILLIGKR